MNLREVTRKYLETQIKSSRAVIACAQSRLDAVDLLPEVEGVSHITYSYDIVAYPDDTLTTDQLAANIASALHQPIRRRKFNEYDQTITWKIASMLPNPLSPNYNLDISVRGALSPTCTLKKTKTGERVVEEFQYEVHCRDDAEDLEQGTEELTA